jgi:hypothetical protein
MGYATWMADALTDFGVPFLPVAGWETRGESVFDPAGVMNHHTADTDPTTSALSVIINGRADLPGPLANFYLEWDGTIYLVAAGEANHAGNGRFEVLDRVTRDLAPLGDASAVYGPGSDDYVGNDHYVGIEVQHPGDSTPYPDVVIDSLIGLNAALCVDRGWTANRCIHHREHTYRKVDMSWKGDLRGMVTERMEQVMADPKIDRPDYVTDALLDRLIAAKVIFAKPTSETEDIWRTYVFIDRTLAAAKAAIPIVPAPVAGLKRGDTVTLT